MATTSEARRARIAAIASRWRSFSPTWALIALAVCYLLGQLLFLDWRKYLSFDEATYVSQFSPYRLALTWDAHRSHGIPFLTLPIVLLTAKVTVLRLYLLVVSAVALVLAFRPWVSVLRGYTGVLAALLFATNWIAVYYGSEAMPNLYAAFGAAAAIGYLVALLWDGGGRGALIGAALGFATLAVMRPTESIWLALPCGAAVLAFGAGRRVVGLGALGGGLALGWSPWVIEAFFRFGDPLERVETARSLSEYGTGRTISLPFHLRALDGTLGCCFGKFRQEFISVPGLVWWIALAVLAVAGLALAAPGLQRRASALAFAGGATIAFSYLFLVPVAAPRYLLPAYALLAVPAAVAVARVAAIVTERVSGPARVAVAAVALVPFVLYLGWHAAVARKVAESERVSRALALEGAKIARESGVRPPCYILGSRAATFAFALECQTGPTGRKRNLRDRTTTYRHIRAGERVAIFWGSRLPNGSFATTWERVRAGRWYMYVPPNAPWFDAPPD